MMLSQELVEPEFRILKPRFLKNAISDEKAWALG
jgi:hypothetical protein